MFDQELFVLECKSYLYSERYTSVGVSLSLSLCLPL